MKQADRRKIRYRVNDCFADRLKEAFAEAHPEIAIETEWNIIAMNRVTRRVDGKKFTPKEHAFIKGFSTGYYSASEQV